MKTKFKHEINYIAIILAISSFCIGALLLFLYLIFDNSIVGIGFYYTFVAAMLNILMIIILGVNTISNYHDYKENLMTILAVLANIPITIIYMDIVI